MTAADLIAALTKMTKAEREQIRELLGFDRIGIERPTLAEITGDADAGKGFKQHKR
jgi:hypothetical protein